MVLIISLLMIVMSKMFMMFLMTTLSLMASVTLMFLSSDDRDDCDNCEFPSFAGYHVFDAGETLLVFLSYLRTSHHFHPKSEFKKRTLGWGIRSESITSPLRLRKPHLDTSNPPSHAHPIPTSHAHPIPTSHAQPHFVTFIS
jgi:hypothetical protein